MAKAEWLNVVLQTVKPENEFSQFNLQQGPRCLGNRNPDRNGQEPQSLHFGAYPLGFLRGFLFAGALARSPHLGPERVVKSPGNVSGNGNITTSKHM